MSARDWFRTRRQLRATIDQQRNLLTERFNQLHDAGIAIKNAQDAYQKARNLAADRAQDLLVANEQVRQLTTDRDDLREQNVRVRNALQVLREDIRRAEEIEHPPTAGGVGMIRPLAQRSPMADRILRRPWPADLAVFPPRTRDQAEAIDDHARDKRTDDL